MTSRATIQAKLSAGRGSCDKRARDGRARAQRSARKRLIIGCPRRPRARLARQSGRGTRRLRRGAGGVEKKRRREGSCRAEEGKESGAIGSLLLLLLFFFGGRAVDRKETHMHRPLKAAGSRRGPRFSSFARLNNEVTPCFSLHPPTHTHT